MAAFQEDPAALTVMDAARPPAVVALFSNNDALVGSLVGQYLPGVAARCDAIVFAGVLGVRKPAEQSYTRALQELAVAAERCLFVDDNPDTTLRQDTPLASTPCSTPAPRSCTAS